MHELAHALAAPEDELRANLESALAADRAGVQRRLAGADATQYTADEAATANHVANVLFNVMRGGTFEDGYRFPRRDLASYLHDQDRDVASRHDAWLSRLPDWVALDQLIDAAEERRDPRQLPRKNRATDPHRHRHSISERTAMPSISSRCSLNLVVSKSTR